jgi:CarD family transcriptional regulator
MELAVGDMVVYGTHGIGRVAAREKQLVVVELDEGLRVTLPLERAHEILRGVADKAEMRKVQQALRDDRALSEGPWLARRKEALDKLTGGDPVRLAEIVSEGAQRERMRRASGSKAQLSSGEKEIFVRARKLLSNEIALSLGVQQDAADVWIDEQLARPV